MPRAHRLARLALPAVLLAGAVAAAPAAAQAPAEAPTVTAAASADVTPIPRYRNDEDSIRKAVRIAGEKALPLAIAAAHERAAKLAAAAGTSLGTLVAITEPPTAGFPFFLIAGQNGTYGPNRYCRQVRSFRIERTSTGQRRRVATKSTHKVCRTPPSVTASVSVTYTLATGAA